MSVTLIGLVSYEDDGKVFRKVYPEHDDSELDDPQWTTDGCDPTRKAVLHKIPIEHTDVHTPFTGTPF